MKYQSTRNKGITASAAEAILNGLAPDGGLYVLPDLKKIRVDYDCLLKKDIYGMASELLALLLPSFDRKETERIVRRSFEGKFETEDITPTVSVGEETVLELFSGPTAAFKDVALSVLPNLMSEARKKCGFSDGLFILTATSGDTGKAAMEGFRDVPGTNIAVFYPKDGVSDVQRAQMATQEGKNVHVFAVNGNFDDAQREVKRIFEKYSGKGPAAGVRLSSANSINVGRLAPQTVYYFKAYADLVKRSIIALGEKVDFCVPTGNFGNILAGFLAREMGLPVGRLVCASNANNVLTDFITSGRYDRNRPFYKTLSPSMDILVSSNLERLLFCLGAGEETVARLMRELSEKGAFDAPRDITEKMHAVFSCAWCSDGDTVETIGKIWRRHKYLCDTHTAVAFHAAEEYKKQYPGHGHVVVLSTASPFKFPAAALEGLGVNASGTGTELMRKLSEETGLPVPRSLAGVGLLPERHLSVISKEEMESCVLRTAERIASGR